VGLELPLRATTALAVVTLILLFDFSRTAIPEPVQDLGRAAAANRYVALERLILFGLVPVLVIRFAFRDRASDYGLRIGAWRWGLGLALLGGLAMTPIVALVAQNPDFREYYGISSAGALDLLVTHVLDLTPTEFLFRGFLMFTLIRSIGPLGIVVVQLPFVFAHLGKPEVELFSTLLGGTVFAWLDWRTGSIIWSAAAHVYILTLLLVLVGR
jgi:membrane protease YdiL (CAAX protease family)